MLRRRPLRMAPIPLLAFTLVIMLFRSTKDYEPAATDQTKPSLLAPNSSSSSFHHFSASASPTVKPDSHPGTSHGGTNDAYDCSLSRSAALKISARAVAEMKSIEDFFKYVENPTEKCRHLKTFGGFYTINWFFIQKITDGEKRVCLDPEYGLVQKKRSPRRTRQKHLPKGLLSLFSSDPSPAEPKSPDSTSSTPSRPHAVSSPGTCLVYSFGINNEWSFDSAMANFGCNVHAFDPTMDIVKNKPKGVEFHKLGIGRKDSKKMIGNYIRDVRRLGTLLEMLGHAQSNVTIDYLKIDTEGAELDFFEDVLNHSPHLLNKIRQIGMEIHPKTYSKTREHVFKQYYRYFMQLENHGFKLIHSEENPIPKNYYFLPELNRRVDGFYEMVWAKRCL